MWDHLLATSPQPWCFVSGHSEGGSAMACDQPAVPEEQVPIAEKLPALPSQLFGSPVQDTTPYLDRIKASIQGVHGTAKQVI